MRSTTCHCHCHEEPCVCPAPVKCQLPPACETKDEDWDDALDGEWDGPHNTPCILQQLQRPTQVKEHTAFVNAAPEYSSVYQV